MGGEVGGLRGGKGDGMLGGGGEGFGMITLSTTGDVGEEVSVTPVNQEEASPAFALEIKTAAALAVA